MIRLIAFLIAVGCCIGLISGSYTAIVETEDDVTFTETVNLGDPAVMNGRTARFGVTCGAHMLWRTTYQFAEEDRYTTEFTFSQENLSEGIRSKSDVLAVYAHSGWGVSTTGALELGQSGYADMIRTVAALTQPGEEGEMNLKLADFVDYHALNFDLNYTSDRYICHEYADQFSALSFIDSTADSVCCEAFSQLFRFPVQPDEIVTITVYVNAAGDISDAGYNTVNDLQINVINAATDKGLYCIPQYLNNEKLVPGEYAQGMGVYFIPWKEYDDGYTYASGRQRVTLDVENARNIYLLPEDAVIYGLEVDDASQTAWILTLEGGVYVLTRMELASGNVLTRMELMEAGERQPVWHIRENLMAVRAGGHLALVSTDGTPRVEFIAPLGDAADGFYYFTRETGNMLYEDGVLYLVDFVHFNEYLNVMAYDKTGPLYWGEYRCSLYDCDEQGGSPYLQAQYVVTELE